MVPLEKLPTINPYNLVEIFLYLPADLEDNDDETGLNMSRAASAIPSGGPDIAGWKLDVISDDLSLVLWYPEELDSDMESFCEVVSRLTHETISCTCDRQG